MRLRVARLRHRQNAMTTTLAALRAVGGLGNGGPRSPNGREAIVTLDVVDAVDGTGRAPALCFCVDCFSGSDDEQSGARLSRVLSHVTPGSPLPRDLLATHAAQLQDSMAPGQIPWCVELRPAASSAAARPPPPPPPPATSGVRGRSRRVALPAVAKAVGAQPVAAAPDGGLKAAVSHAIDRFADELDAVAADLHANPEEGTRFYQYSCIIISFFYTVSRDRLPGSLCARPHRIVSRSPRL
eukprot:SAG31_NODE_5800_length_2322_cov_15.403509_3_plen_241_part_00